MTVMSDHLTPVVGVLADLATERARLRADLHAARSAHPANSARDLHDAALSAQLELARVERTSWAVVASIREVAIAAEERRRRKGPSSDPGTAWGSAGGDGYRRPSWPPAS